MTELHFNTIQEFDKRAELWRALKAAGWTRLRTNVWQNPETGFVFEFDQSVMMDGKARARWAIAYEVYKRDGSLPDG